ncbi:hypothetical protein [Hamadaea tsunoensis]|uniref:hypothetical protein n=1 Tax=Hamadaea tsunoensis TaxID=53368 RepID=UPI0004861724|nr:hypothetical protein [Hamadaea tsunoensis]
MATHGVRLLRNALSSAAVLAVILFVAFGLPAINRAVPASKDIVGGRAYTVGGGVSVVPPLRAEIDPSKTRPAADRGTVLFLLGAVRYVIVVAPFSGGLGDAAARLREKITATRGYQVTGDEAAVRTSTGLPGLAGCYSAPGRLGRYAVFVSGGSSIEVTISGTEDQLAGQMAGIEASVSSIQRK